MTSPTERALCLLRALEPDSPDALESLCANRPNLAATTIRSALGIIREFIDGSFTSTGADDVRIRNFLIEERDSARSETTKLRELLKPFAHAWLKHDGVNRHFSEFICDDHVEAAARALEAVDGD